jgi:2-(1,2-epoxy-1,2-dihydrophenyl)acetyl-CoA isomerase
MGNDCIICYVIDHLERIVYIHIVSFKEACMDVIKEETRDEVLTITLNRPDKKNAMDLELLTALHGALENAQRLNPPLVLIRGAGRAFCAGGDVLAFKESEDPASLTDQMAQVLHKNIVIIRHIGSIVIAVLDGVAVGAGVGLSLACDLTVAAKNSVMNMGYRRIGLTPDGGASIFLPRLMGAKRFNEFYLLSRNIGMAEAKELGLVNFVCEEAELETTVSRIVRELMALPMETIKPFKDLVNRSLFLGLETHLEKERFYVTELAGKPLFKERLEDFFRRK